MNPPIEAIAPIVQARAVGGWDFNASLGGGMPCRDALGVVAAGVVAAGVSAGVSTGVPFSAGVNSPP